MSYVASARPRGEGLCEAFEQRKQRAVFKLVSSGGGGEATSTAAVVALATVALPLWRFWMTSEALLSPTCYSSCSRLNGTGRPLHTLRPVLMEIEERTINGVFQLFDTRTQTFTQLVECI
jgi:hypothetical protein